MQWRFLQRANETRMISRRKLNIWYRVDQKKRSLAICAQVDPTWKSRMIHRQGWISVENILPWLITLFFNLIAHSNTIFFVVLYPWEFKTVFNNQLHILINLGKYVIARPNHLWGYKNQLWSLTFSTLNLQCFSRASAARRLAAQLIVVLRPCMCFSISGST